jgi:hypothetical protein
VLGPDGLEPRERSSGVVQAKGQAAVDVLLAPHALADGEESLIHQLGDDPAEDEAGRVLDPLGRKAQPPEEALSRLGGERVSGGQAGQLDEPGTPRGAASGGSR